MPGLDRKGPPFGDGNQSGRRMGKCNPENKDTDSTTLNRGMGRRWRQRFEGNPQDDAQYNEPQGRGAGRKQGMGKGSGRGMGRGRNRQ